MSKFLGWGIGIVLVVLMYSLNLTQNKLDNVTAELDAVRTENYQLRQQKIIADETAESARKKLEVVNAENQYYKLQIHDALKNNPLWAGTALPDDLAGLLQQNYCISPGPVPAP